MGKRKISMEWISNQQRRHVTFSKRRKGLFKKAHELCCLTGATVAIICFSEAGNAFTFSYPPPADDQEGDEGRRRLLSIMQQHYDHSGSPTITTTHSQPPNTRLPVAESKSILDENSGSGLLQSVVCSDSLWASLDPLHGGGVSASDASSFGFGSSSGSVGEVEQEMGLIGRMQSMDEAETALLDSILCQLMVDEQDLVDSSVYGSVSSCSHCDSSCLPPPASLSVDVLQSFSWKDILDILEKDAFEGGIIPSPFYFHF